MPGRRAAPRWRTTLSTSAPRRILFRRGRNRFRVELSRQYLDGALELVEASEAPVERVAELAGFGSATKLRKHFAKYCGVSPTRYRYTFRQSHDHVPS